MQNQAFRDIFGRSNSLVTPSKSASEAKFFLFIGKKLNQISTYSVETYPEFVHIFVNSGVDFASRTSSCTAANPKSCMGLLFSAMVIISMQLLWQEFLDLTIAVFEWCSYPNFLRVSQHSTNELSELIVLRLVPWTIGQSRSLQPEHTDMSALLYISTCVLKGLFT